MEWLTGSRFCGEWVVVSEIDIGLQDLGRKTNDYSFAASPLEAMKRKAVKL
jgi:hypothetical protein